MSLLSRMGTDGDAASCEYCKCKPLHALKVWLWHMMAQQSYELSKMPSLTSRLKVLVVSTLLYVQQNACYARADLYAVDNGNVGGGAAATTEQASDGSEGERASPANGGRETAEGASKEVPEELAGQQISNAAGATTMDLCVAGATLMTANVGANDVEPERVSSRRPMNTYKSSRVEAASYKGPLSSSSGERRRF
eukprot:3695923-Pyramimonas_sp.AAC.1